LPKQRLGIEGLELRRAAGLEEVDDALGPGTQMRRREHAARRRRLARCAQKRAEGDAAQSKGAGAEEMAPGQCHAVVVGAAHRVVTPASDAINAEHPLASAAASPTPRACSS